MESATLLVYLKRNKGFKCSFLHVAMNWNQVIVLLYFVVIFKNSFERFLTGRVVRTC